MAYREKIKMARCDWRSGPLLCETIAVWTLFDSKYNTAVAVFCDAHIDGEEAEYTRMEREAEEDARLREAEAQR